MKSFNIEYASSDAYYKFTLISIKSVVKSNPNYTFVFHIFYDDMTIEHRKIIENFIITSSNSVVFYNINDYSEIVNNVYSHGVKNAYMKLLLSKIIDVDLILHLGSDTLVNSDISDIFNTNMDEILVAGVQDTVLLHDRKLIKFEKDDPYICSDVTLHNLKYQREVDFYGKCVECLKTFNGRVCYADQGMLNYCAKGHLKVIPLKYCIMPPAYYFNNKMIRKLYHIKKYYSDEEMNEAKNNPVIIHFTNGFYGKPWFSECKSPYKNLFLSFSEGDSSIELQAGDGMNKNSKRMASLFYRIQ